MRVERGPPPVVPGIVIGVLGTTTLTSPHGEPVPLTVAERKLLTLLAAVEEDGATLAHLEEVVWSGTPPTSARQSLHNHIHRLRTKLGGTQLRHDGDRYRLRPRPRTDLADFESLVAAAERALQADDAGAALELIRQARSLWRGEPYADLPTIPGVVWARARFNSLHAAADDLFVRALLATGHTAEGMGELEQLLAADPGNEARWEMFVETLQRAGRRSEALDAFRRARENLVASLGIEPGERLQELQRFLLEGTPVAAGAAGELDPVGRDSLIGAVIAALGDRRLVALRGEGGIGKTALLRGVAARWAGEVIVVRCGGNPFAALGPVASLVDALAPRLRRAGLPTSLADITAPLTGNPLSTGKSPGTLVHRAIGVISAGLSEDPSTLLVLDDVDQAGPTTRSILADVTGSVPVPVLATMRDADAVLPGWPEDTEVEVGGLDVDGAVALTRQVLSVKSATEFGTWLHEFTGGHPLFMLAVISDLLGRGVLEAGRPEPAPPVSAPVPAHVRDALQRRIAALGPRARRAVDVVAVLGEPLASSLIGDLAPAGDLDHAVREGILVEDGDGRLWFAHDLLHKVAYDYVPSGRRAELHHAAAGLDWSAAHRASHLLAAGDLDPPAAVEAAARAGADAAQAQAYGEAVAWYERALEAGDGVLDALVRLELRVEQADARRLAGMSGHADLLLAAAEESVQIGDGALRRRAMLATLQLGEAVEPGPIQQRAGALADEVLDSEPDDGWWARIAAAASLVHSIGEPVRCRELLLSAWTRAPDDQAVLADVLPYAYMALSHPDDLPDRSKAAHTLTAAAERTHNPVAAFEAGHLRFSVALQHGDGPAARRAHEAMGALTDQVADAGRRWSLAYQGAALAAIDGRLEESERLAEQALDIGSGVAPRRAFGAYAGQLFELRRLEGRLAELQEVALQLVDDQPEVPGWAAVGALAVSEADPDRSRSLFDTAAAEDFSTLPRDFAWLAAVMCLGRTAAALQDAERAARVLPVLGPYREIVCWQGTCTWGPVAEVLADLARVLGDDVGARQLDDLAAARHAGLAAVR